jgi:SET domain-containing protein
MDYKLTMDGMNLVIIKNSIISGQGSFAKNSIPKGNYIGTLTGKPFKKEYIVQNDDPLQIDENTYLELDTPSKTINHSCNPNTGIRNQSDLYAIRDIALGEELTYDYSTTIGIDDNLSSMPCKCGAKNCRQTIGNVLTIPDVLLKLYANLDVLPLFIRRQLGV